MGKRTNIGAKRQGPGPLGHSRTHCHAPLCHKRNPAPDRPTNVACRPHSHTPRNTLMQRNMQHATRTMQHATPIKAYAWLRRGQGSYDEFPDEWRSTAYTLRRVWPDYLNFRACLAEIAKAHEPLPYWDGSPLAPTDWLCPTTTTTGTRRTSPTHSLNSRLCGVQSRSVSRGFCWGDHRSAENRRSLP